MICCVILLPNLVRDCLIKTHFGFPLKIKFAWGSLVTMSYLDVVIDTLDWSTYSAFVH